MISSMLMKGIRLIFGGLWCGEWKCMVWFLLDLGGVVV